MLALSLVSHRDCLQHAGHQLLGSFHFVYSMMNASVDIHLETENSAGGIYFLGYTYQQVSVNVVHQ